MSVGVDMARHYIAARGVDNLRAGRVEALSHFIDLAKPNANIGYPVRSFF